MNREEFANVVNTVTHLWPRYAAKDWNDANRDISFRKFNCFTVHQVCNGLELQRMDEPDGKAPDWKALNGKLWAIKKGRDAQKSEPEDFRYLAFQWARNQSDDDLRHYGTIGLNNAMTAAPKLWSIIEAAELRSPICVIVAWAATRDMPLSFASGTQEWQELYIEYDLMERRRENERIGDWMAYKRRTNAPKPLPKEPYLLPAPVGVAVEEVPF